MIGNLDKLKPLRSLLTIVVEWLLIALSVAVYIRWHFLAFILIPFIATRMYALYSLLHDGVHGLLLKNRRVNDVVSNIFLALPLFTTVQQMRKKHFLHHGFLKGKKDPESKQADYPEFNFPMTRLQFFLIVVKDLTGYNFIYYTFKKLMLNKQPKDALVLIMLTITVILFFYNPSMPIKIVLFCWLLPYITAYQLLNRFRLIFEHYNLGDKDVDTRTMVFNPIVAFFIAPHNIGYHTEHHLYPNVPHYRLTEVHQYLINSGKDIKIDRSPIQLLKSILK